ncbi:DUF1003 domain-containing protein [Bradyrhizobium japonicum]|uniref:DUF1003 domain-containing protein n=1 Tax=Bradyrhizobium japonicum TaxID=375 RepID=UPI001BA535D8|nr:DUF1003 domain-containing protein [Bradyrhizobium japonicum]MBR0993515.1 DUF1003 domain-containing protein [Bradyrhizobium japonicum]
MQAGTRSEKPAAQSIDAILRLEKQDEKTLAVHHRLFHWIGWFAGTIQFIVLQCAFVLGWIIFSRFFPHYAFDEYPFPLLATILAVEAVLLTSCVLIRQSLIDRTLERRDHLELQINLLAEKEATQSLRILQRIAKKLDVEDAENSRPDELASETPVDQIAQDLRDRQDEAAKQ